MKYKIILILTLLVGLSQNTKACDCAPMLNFEKYSFIALVSVDSVHRPIAIVSPQNPKYKQWSYKIEITIRTQFKGQEADKIGVIGGNAYYEEGASSCDIYIEEGDDWIIFGFGKGPNPITGFCTASIRYGHSKMNGQSSFRIYDDLYEYYFSNSCGPPDGYRIMNHLNGQISSVSCYENDLQEGEQLSYYPNGNVKSQQFYIQGKIYYTARFFYENGSVMDELAFWDNQMICDRKYYTVEGALEKIDHYDEEGYFMISTFFE